MNSSEEILRELEIKRKALNERLMNTTGVAEANGIERELWALRAAIRHHKSRIANGLHAGRSRSNKMPQSAEKVSDSSDGDLPGRR